MAKNLYVISETLEQAARRRANWQKERAILVRYMNDPQVQEVVDYFLKLGRIPEEKESFKYLKVFGKTYEDFQFKAAKKIIRLFQALAVFFFVGNILEDEFSKEICLCFIAFVYWGLFFLYCLSRVINKKMRRCEVAVCLLVASNLP